MSKAKHAIITDQCRANRGDEEAFDEAVRRLRNEYKAILDAHDENDVRYHLSIHVEWPDR